MALEEDRKLEFFFLPFLVAGHMIPMVDMARLFAARGVKTTIITTPLNALSVQKAIEHDKESGHQIGFHLIKFPSAEVGMPEGIENFNCVTSTEMTVNFMKAISLLQQPIEQLFRERLPDCIVSDMFFPWTADVATQLGIPRILYYSSGFFHLCVDHSLESYKPHHEVLSDTEPFLLPGLPDQIKLTRSQLSTEYKLQNSYTKLIQRVRESVPKSYGVLVHSFYELEPAYVEYYRKNVKEKVWHIGPVGPCNRDDTIVKAERGSKAYDGVHKCLDWLDSQKPNSVLYICFGSLTRFTNAQLFEIASSLEASNHPFIWMVRKDEKLSSSGGKEWLPEGFEKRMVDGKIGMIIMGWAPQLVILEHPAIGGFMTHTGWNSLLESITAGVPLITWPLYAEQFFNEKLVTQVLNIGDTVGVEGPNSLNEEEKILVKREKIENAIGRLMDSGDDAETIRKRMRELSTAAMRTMEEGGSSYANLTTLIQEVRLIRAT